MNIANLNSSAIRQLDYDEDNHTLTITFTSGHIEIRGDMPKAMFEAFRDAESPGQFYNQNIKGRL